MKSVTLFALIFTIIAIGATLVVIVIVDSKREHVDWHFEIPLIENATSVSVSQGGFVYTDYSLPITINGTNVEGHKIELYVSYYKDSTSEINGANIKLIPELIMARHYTIIVIKEIG